jgi:serine/threonine protein kinase
LSDDTPVDASDAQLELAAGLSDGAAIDWEQAAAAAPDAGARRLIRELRTLARVRDVSGQPAAPSVPEVWGHLRLLGAIGTGGYGTVHRAWDSQLEREVALKLLNRGAGETLLEEGRLLARLRHPNVVTVYGTDSIDGRLGIWMELLKGRTLAQLIEIQGPFGPREASLVGLDLCRALAAVHRAGLVHGDVKAQNVMREEGGRIVLMDFGIGRRIAADTEPAVRGTLRYVPPEVLESGTAASSADIYSLGVLLYHLVTGSFPMDGDDAESLLQAHRQRSRSFLRDARPDLPEPFVQAVECALMAEPGRRFATMGAMEAALAAALGIGAAPGPAAGAPAAPETGLIEPSHRLEYLERAAEDLRALCQDGSTRENAILERLSDFVAEGTLLCEQLAAAWATRPDQTEGETLVLSLCHLTEQVEREIGAPGLALPSLEGYRVHLQKAVLRPAQSLLQFLEERRHVRSEAGFLAPQPGSDENASVQALALELVSSDEITRHDAVVAVATGRWDALERGLRSWSRETRGPVLAALWSRVDLLILEGGAGVRRILETAAELAETLDQRERWRELLRLLFGDAPSDAERAKTTLLALGPEDARIFGRALLLHHEEAYRQLAFEVLQPVDFWEVVTHPGTPIRWLLEIWRHLRGRVGDSYLKVFFVCVRESVLRSGGPERIVSVVDLVKEFYLVDAFHEDTFFRMLAEMDQRVREHGLRHGLLINFDTDYVDTVRRFLASGSRGDRGIEDWSLTPLPIQRRVARLGHFLKHFVCHPLDPIAYECLPHLRILGDVTDYVTLYAINSRVLADLAKETHLFRREEARFALVANPKTPAHIVRHHVRLLRKDSLRRLSENRQGNSFARNLALHMLR